MAQTLHGEYGKPVLLDEFGTDWRGWNETNDPYLRGFRQGIWGGALGGSVGTAMSWWWENIQSEDLYPVDTGLGTILNRTGWGRGTWTNITFATSGLPPPLVGDPVAGGQPFDVTLNLSGVWGGMPSGQLAVANASAADDSASTLNSFVHGIWHSDLKVPFRLSAWFTNNARLVMHLNSVSDGAILVVRADGTEMYRTNLPNLDGGYSVNNEYDVDLAVNLPSGKRLVEITNAGTDWFFLDWVRLEQVLPAAYSPAWAPSPEAVGLAGTHESLLYVVAPGVSFPGQATNGSLPLQQGQTVTLQDWPDGRYYAEWYTPATGASLSNTTAVASRGKLVLPLPDFSEDVAGIVYPPPVLKPHQISRSNPFQFQLSSETGGRYAVERSVDLTNWNVFTMVTNSDGVMGVSENAGATNGWAFFRAKGVGR